MKDIIGIILAMIAIAGVCAFVVLLHPIYIAVGVLLNLPWMENFYWLTLCLVILSIVLNILKKS